MDLLYVQEQNGIWRKRTASLDHYDAEYLERLIAFFADPRIAGRYFLNSGSRSYAAQVVLYARYLASGRSPRYLAAKPNTSNHEYGSTHHPFTTAGDVNPFATGSYAELHAVAYEYGFHFPIASEPWHMELRPGRGPLPHKITIPLEEDDMPRPDTRIDACIAPNGGVWTLTYDGGVRATKGAPFYGAYPGLPDEQKKGGPRNFIAIEPVGDGYTIISDNDTADMYHFGPQ